MIPPTINGYQFYAYPLAIILNHKETHPWFYSNYIQLAFDKDFYSPVPFCFYMYDYAINPWLNVQRLQRNIFDITGQDIVDFVKNALDNQYYVYLNVDEYHIPERSNFHKKHISHDVLVYGYDLENNTFDVLGFNDKTIFKNSKVRFSEFRHSFASLDIIENNCHQIYLYQYNPHGTYSFNTELVIETLEDYLFSRNTSKKVSMLTEEWDRHYGMDSYKQLNNYYQGLLNNDLYIDVKFTHILWEHKKVMGLRAKYMCDLGLITEELVEAALKIEDQALVLRNLFIKYSMTHKKNIIFKMIEMTHSLQKEEEQLIKNIINQLKLSFTKSVR